jgi:hypothetical protein
VLERKENNNNNNNNNRSKNNKSPKRCLGDLIIRNRAKTISLPNFGSKGVGVTIESYGKVEISYINVDNF